MNECFLFDRNSCDKDKLKMGLNFKRHYCGITLFSSTRPMLSQSDRLLRAAQQTVVMYLKRKCQYIAVGQRSWVQTGLTSSKPHVGELVNHALKLYWLPIKLFLPLTNSMTFPRGTTVCFLQSPQNDPITRNCKRSLNKAKGEFAQMSSPVRYQWSAGVIVTARVPSQSD